MNQTTDAARAKPRFALAIATSLGLGYLPKAPGTWGSVMGVLIYGLTRFYFPLNGAGGATASLAYLPVWTSWTGFPVTVVLALVGVWAASRAATFSGLSDPQFVVIDEVSGQLISYLGLATPRTIALNWKYLLLGLILFRVFDIWKPFPARQAESLPGGLGIMADDWMAGVYAALVLGFARYLSI